MTHDKLTRLSLSAAISAVSSTITEADYVANHPAIADSMRQDRRIANHEQIIRVGSSRIDIPQAVLGLHDASLRSALTAYFTTPALVQDIARKHGFSPSSISHWVRKLGLPLRGRGRRPSVGATRQQRRLLNLARKHGMAAAARRIGCSRQRVHYVVTQKAPELLSLIPRSPCIRRARRQPRESVVSFRVTPEQLKDLAHICIPNGRRGLSAHEKAREVVLGFLGSSRQPPHLFTSPSPVLAKLNEAV